MFRRLKQNCVLVGFAAFSAASAFGSASNAAEDWEVIGDGVFPTGADLNAVVMKEGLRICYWGGPGMWPTDGALATKVRGMGIPTHVVPREYKQVSLPGRGLLVATTPYRVFNRNVFSAKFKPSLLKEGENEIEPMEFPPSGVCVSTFWFIDAILKSPTGRKWPLSRYDRTCLMCEVSPPFEDKSINLSLADIDPALVRYLENFKAAIMKDRETLIANAAQVANLAEALDRLDMVETEIQDLVSRGLDELTPEYLNELLQRYQDLPPESRDALVKLIEDRHKDVLELRAELDRITSTYKTFEDTVVGLLGNTLAGASFDPERVDNFLPPSLEDIPGVSVPIGSGTAFDPARDPYKAHANKVITTLRSYTANGKVVARAAYISLVRQWRRNQNALEASLKELRARGSVSTAEWGAFLAARGQVTNEIAGYLDLSDWFKDCPVPENLRALVDGHLMRKEAELAVALKEALNEWKDDRLTDQQRLVSDTLTAVVGGMEGLDESDVDSRAHVKAALSGATAFAKMAVGIGVGLTPWGDFMDACEAATGYEACIIGGHRLSVTERVYSGLGCVIGSGSFWKLASSSLGGGAAVVFIRIEKLSDKLADLPIAERRALRTHLDSTLAELDELRGREIQRLVETFRDADLRLLAPHLKGKSMLELAEMKMFHAPATGGFQFDGVAKAFLANPANGAMARRFPSYLNRTMAELKTEFYDAAGALRPGWRDYPMNSAGQLTFTHDDGSVIRIATIRTTARDRPHYKVEISNTPHASGLNDIVCKVTHTHEIVPANIPPKPNGPPMPLPGARDLNKWFLGKTGPIPGVPPGVEKALGNVWADLTHIDFR